MKLPSKEIPKHLDPIELFSEAFQKELLAGPGTRKNQAYVEIERKIHILKYEYI